ncbi:MAG: DUF2997 domain-containing protein [Microcoleus vaginatus WJT46-NPBG5]|nr:DUF2997 domain-containing protein [Microcoleus vaginatus WJT46-NPBG5]
MKYYRIEFTINADGIVTEKVIATGPNCTAVTEGLEVAIGEVQSQEFLPQYNQPDIENTGSEELWNQM